MLIIPAIDLRRGCAVQASSGQRDRYRPLSTKLCPDGDPCTLVQRLLAVYPFPVCYLADLDAIESTGDNDHHVSRLLNRFPSVTFWLDAGFSRPEAYAGWRDRPGIRPVIGSESQGSLASCTRTIGALAPTSPILSLDFREGQFLGPAPLLTRRSDWTEDVILMDLDRVGTHGGPSTSAVPDCVGGPPRRFFAAGGVRHGDDIRQLRALGYAGVLVASALHAGRLDGAGIAALADGGH